MANRDVEFAEVLDALENYENRWDVRSFKGRPTPGRAVYQRGKLAIVVNERTGTWWVVTVLLRENRQWTDEDARARSDTSPSTDQSAPGGESHTYSDT